MTSRYSKMRKQRLFEKEHWYVTNIDHISLKIQMTTGRLLITVVHDKQITHLFYQIQHAL